MALATKRRIAATVTLAGALAISVAGPPSVGAVTPAGNGIAVTPYVTGDVIDAQPPPGTSLYLDPGREYLETVPATTLLNGIGLNYTLPSNADHLDAIALLASAGVRSLRIEIGWRQLTSDIGGLSAAAQARFGAILAACARNGITPLILLNANDQQPEPAVGLSRHVLTAAPKGSRSVVLDDTSSLVVGHSGLSQLTPSWPAAGALITAIGSGGKVALSRPLPADLAAGATVHVDTLTHLPLYPVNSLQFEDTSAAWLHYVGVVTDFVRNAGVPTFGVEVWNELTFGSSFLDINNYYSPPLSTPYGYSNFRGGGPAWELAQRTTNLVHVKSPGTRVIWGFSNTNFSGTPIVDLPSGIDGQSYHPYATQPLPIATALSGHDVSLLHDGGWLPSVTVGVPESIFALDLKPEELAGGQLAPPERSTARPPGTSTFVQIISEHGVSPSQAGITDVAGSQQYKAVAALRALTFWLNKGVTTLDLYSAWSSTDSSFGALPASPDPSTYASVPASTLMTPELTAIQRLVASMHGAQPLSTTRQLSVGVVSMGPETPVFTGDSQHPSLFYRNFFTFLPFQVTPHRFVVSTYVMSWNLSQRLGTMAFQVTIGGLNGVTAQVSMQDPVSGLAVGVPVLSRTASSVTVSIDATDSPRLLTIDD